MPSQEEYLDNLLKGFNESDDMDFKEADGEEVDFAGAEINEFTDPDVAIGVDDTVHLSEEDIERLLSEEDKPVMEEIPVMEEMSSDGQDSDLMDLLKQEENSDYQEIQEMLQKADNNEAVSDDIVALLENVTDEQINPLEEIEQENIKSEESAFDEKASRSAARKKEKEARKAEKNAMKEAKKAARREEKAARKAENKAKQETASEEISLQEGEKNQSESASADIPESKGDEVQQIFDDMDLSGLDALFADIDAEQVSDIKQDKKQNETAVADNSRDKISTDSLVEKLVDEKRPKKKPLSKLLDFLTEEVEEEEDSAKNNENIQLSDENKTIIDELDKDKKKKKKKGKKDRGTKENSSDEESESGSDKDKKRNKPQKEKKVKKVKTEKNVEEDNSYRRGSKLTFKQILPMLLRCLSVAVIIILASNIVAEYSAKKAAKEAYYNGDYETCYQYLFGKDRNESEQIMYSKSECILRIRMWIREYEMLVEEGLEAEALDSLIQSVDKYPLLYEYAVQWNAGPDMEEPYARILGILSEKYHLTEAQAFEIADTRSDVEYSKMIYTIADGGEFGSWNTPKSEDTLETPEVLEDLLQEEADLSDTPFVDNN